MTRRRYASLDWWRLALRGRARAYTKSVFFRPYVFEDKTVEGEPIPFYIANATGDEWYGRDSDPFNIEMRYVRDKLVRDGMTIFECGGHNGMDTVLLARWAGSGSVVTFEPLMENVAVIHANLGLNNVTNVVVEAAAIGSTEGRVVMKRASSNGSVRPHGGKGTSVKVDTLDGYCARTGRVPDLIKIDVEGYELSVLAGATETLADHPALLIEVHCDSLPKYGEDPDTIWKYVDKDSYDIAIQWNDLAEPVPYKGETMVGRVHLFCTPRDNHRS